MFRIIYVDDRSLDGSFRTEETNDIRDLVDIAVGLFDDEPLIVTKVGTIASCMSWGDKFETKDYTIECYKE